MSQERIKNGPMKKKVGILVFPGSNCDHDAYYAMKTVLQADAEFVWHKERELKEYDLIVVPGGFSYGDYLRSGAIARFSPVMEAVAAYAKQGRPVIGICNGFQILLEAGLLPGAMLHNEHLRFICKDVHIRVETSRSQFTAGLEPGDVLKIPVSHGEGNYFTDADGLAALEDQDQILFRYCDANGALTPESNVNGSVASIAGICNTERNVLGMMPHPERAMEQRLGSDHGLRFFEQMMEQLQPA